MSHDTCTTCSFGDLISDIDLDIYLVPIRFTLIWYVLLLLTDILARFRFEAVISRAAESVSRLELESVGVDRFGRSLSRSWSQ